MIATTGLFAVDRVRDTVIVAPTSDLSEISYEPIESGTRQVLLVLNDPSVKNVIVDFHSTDYIGSTALGFLIGLWKRVTERKGTWRCVTFPNTNAKYSKSRNSIVCGQSSIQG
jgi:anti-anti-sigma regulatory factor